MSDTGSYYPEMAEGAPTPVVFPIYTSGTIPGIGTSEKALEPPTIPTEEVAEMKSLLVHDHEGIFMIDVPPEAKITFGPAIPGPRQIRGNMDVYALRIYKGATEKSGLLAVFPGVYGFHEKGSIIVKRRLKDDQGKTMWIADDGWHEDAKKLTNKLGENEVGF